ncbi:AsnC family transcriptional regulator [Haloferacaceae archaeon DSL9]
MRGLDERDREIIRLLLADARRPYSDIAEHVGLSPPAVSDRIDRLRELGVIRSFTVDLDTRLLRDGVPVLVELAVEPGTAKTIRESLSDLDRVEHVFATADSDIVFHATVLDGDVDGLLATAVDLGRVRSIDVRLLTDATWTPRLGEAELALDCAVCGNSVTSEGVSATFNDQRYYFCCSSCEATFEEQFDRISERV